MDYCERSGDGLWAEPVNAITNLVFIVAGLLLLRLLARRDGPPAPWEAVVLVFLVLAIGVGSGLWHTLATPWSALADVLPITLYINVFLVSYLARACRCGLAAGTGLFLLFHGVNAGLAAALPVGFLNGSVFYLPAWTSLGLMALHSRGRGHEGHGLLAAAFGVFTLSLAFRSVDNALCASLPLGTHFLWHLLNGVVLYLTTRFVMAGSMAPRGPRPGAAEPG